ncbi:DMT family transporter [Sporosarcina pasteurii]|uniref:Predicted permeases n=1 Tax=Sporosarcina pasteurii TaxID=1474 RepID=A0A380C099_SPOPA|nr:DMT family transporter [Sporosarcina pasteurii]MDS9471500.1 DMT family transporter [Sporosarcina pasteurii]SUJ10580.1 Predicted permeases [Sporosarcina pasteurii]
MNNIVKGILFMLISSVGFAVMTLFVKLSGDLPSVQKTFFRNLVSVVIAFVLVIYNKESLFGKRENQLVLISRSIFGTLGIIFLFYAIDHLVLSDADMLNKMSPFLVIIFSALFLKEKVLPFQMVTIVMAFIGMLFIVKPSFSVDFIPYLVGVLSAIFAAAAYTFLRVLGNREKFYTVVFYFSFFSTVVLLPFLIWIYEPMTGKQFLYLLLAGLFATVGQFGITLAYKYAAARDISIFTYSTVVFTTIFSFTFFGEGPDLYSLIGYVIILSAMIFMFFRGRKSAPPV